MRTNQISFETVIEFHLESTTFCDCTGIHYLASETTFTNRFHNVCYIKVVHQGVTGVISCRLTCILQKRI